MYMYRCVTSSVGIASHNILTWRITSEMGYIADELYILLVHNRKFPNLEYVDLSK